MKTDEQCFSLHRAQNVPSCYMCSCGWDTAFPLPTATETAALWGWLVDYVLYPGEAFFINPTLDLKDTVVRCQEHSASQRSHFGLYQLLLQDKEGGYKEPRGALPVCLHPGPSQSSLNSVNICSLTTQALVCNWSFQEPGLATGDTQPGSQSRCRCSLTDYKALVPAP